MASSRNRVPSYMSSKRGPSETYGHDIIVPKLSEGYINRVSELDPPRLPSYMATDRSSIDLYGEDITAPTARYPDRGKPKSGGVTDDAPLVRSMKANLLKNGGGGNDPALDSVDSRKEVARPPRQPPVEIPALPLQDLKTNQNQNPNQEAKSSSRSQPQSTRSEHPDLRASSPAVFQWMSEPAAPVVALTPRIPVAELPPDVQEVMVKLKDLQLRQPLFIFLDSRPQALLELFRLPQGEKSAELAAALFQTVPVIVTDGNRRKCGVIGMCQAVVDLLKVHYETDAGAAFTGCKALYYLTYGNLTNAARIKQAGGVELLEAIIKHPTCNARGLGKGRMASKEAQYVLEKLG